MARVIVRSNKIFVMFCINVANMVCHSCYSMPAAFFPQEAKAKKMSDDAIGITFASFAAVMFVFSPVAGRAMSTYGKVWVYILGLVIVSVATICFSAASLLPDGPVFAAWCLCMRFLQGIGSAMEEVSGAAQFSASVGGSAVWNHARQLRITSPSRCVFSSHLPRG